MGRPRKPIQRRASGIYCIQLHTSDGRRVTRSLETRDPIKAAARAAQAIKELQEETKVITKWSADTEVIIGEQQSDGSFKERKTTAVEVLEPEQLLRLGWVDLVREAEQQRIRKIGQPFSGSWHNSAAIVLRQVPFELQEISTQKIRDWMDAMQREGLSPLTVRSKCSLLSGLITTCIKSGLLEGHDNAFDKVDYGTSRAANHIHTATSTDYTSTLRIVPSLKLNMQLVLLIQMYCGTRCSEVTSRVKEDFDLDQGVMVITGAKNKSSNRTVPIPPCVVELLHDFDYKVWPTNHYCNLKLKELNPSLTTHSFRHGLTRMARDLDINAFAIEALLGHRLSTSGMSNIYGQGYGVETMRETVRPIWDRLDELSSVLS